MTIEEKINEIFKDETNPEKIKLMAELKTLVNEKESIFKKMEEDNKALAEAYKNSLMGVKDTSKKEDNSTPPNSEKFNLDKAFQKELSKFLGEKKDEK